MSIINKILQEIEKNRGGKPTDSPDVKLKFGTSFNKYQKKILNPFTVMVVIALILAVTIFFIPHHHTAKKLSLPNKVSATENTQTNNPAKINTANKEISVKLTNIAIDVVNNKTTVNFNLSQATYYYVERSKDQLHLKLTLSNTTYDSEFALKFDHTAIKNMLFHKLNSSVEVDIALLPDSQIIGLQLYDQPQTQLKLTLLNTAVPVGIVSKKSIPLSAEEKANQDYEDALDLLDKNKSDLAISKLYSAAKNSKNPECYELLATLLIRNNSYNEANKTLSSATTKFPNYANYYLLKAYMLMQHGDDKQALEVLLENPPEITQNPDYYALIAHIYQQQNQFLLAAKLYNRLVQIRPERSMWWVGLGIALDAADKKNAAKEAYQRAKSLGNLPTNVSNFVNTKLKKGNY